MDKDFILNKLEKDLTNLILIMVQWHGHTFEYWAQEIQKSNLYAGITCVQTGMWKEGLAYYYTSLIEELGLWSNYGALQCASDDFNITGIMVKLIFDLSDRCNLSQSEISVLIEKTRLMEFVSKNNSILLNMDRETILDVTINYLTYFGIRLEKL